MKPLHLILLGLITLNLMGQTYPQVQSNGYDLDIIEILKSKKQFHDYQFILIKYEDSYWHERLDYRLVCFKDNEVDLYTISKKKKKNITHIRSTPGIYHDFKDMIDTLDSNGLFKLTSEDLKTDLQDENGSKKVLLISDGISDIFGVINQNNLWGIKAYEPKKYYDFSGNENLIIILSAIDLFNKEWSKYH
jgi:hypothetical protein